MAYVFNTVPKHDYLGLLESETPKKVALFLKLNKSDVAKAMGVPKAQVTYDKKMPKDLAEHLREIAVICELVAEHFNGNAEKTLLWFNIKNPLLGGISPKEMICFGRYQKLIKFIQNSLAGNLP